jgi:hypothetical protein
MPKLTHACALLLATVRMLSALIMGSYLYDFPQIAEEWVINHFGCEFCLLLLVLIVIGVLESHQRSRNLMRWPRL